MPKRKKVSSAKSPAFSKTTNPRLLPRSPQPLSPPPNDQEERIWVPHFSRPLRELGIREYSQLHLVLETQPSGKDVQATLYKPRKTGNESRGGDTQKPSTIACDIQPCPRTPNRVILVEAETAGSP